MYAKSLELKSLLVKKSVTRNCGPNPRIPCIRTKNYFSKQQLCVFIFLCKYSLDFLKFKTRIVISLELCIYLRIAVYAKVLLFSKLTFLVDVFNCCDDNLWKNYINSIEWSYLKNWYHYRGLLRYQFGCHFPVAIRRLHPGVGLEN